MANQGTEEVLIGANVVIQGDNGQPVQMAGYNETVVYLLQQILFQLTVLNGTAQTNA